MWTRVGSSTPQPRRPAPDRRLGGAIPDPDHHLGGVETPGSDSLAGVLERFTDRGRRALLLAQEEAKALNSEWVNTEHLLLGLTEEGEGIAAIALQSLGISTEDLRTKVIEYFPSHDTGTDDPQLSRKLKLILDRALREALNLGNTYIGTEHLLLALIHEGDILVLLRERNSEVARLLTSLGTHPALVRLEVMQLIAGYQGPGTVPTRP